MQPANDNTRESAPDERPAPVDSRDEFLLAALGFAVLLRDSDD
jgi:hypothetical protein